MKTLRRVLGTASEKDPEEQFIRPTACSYQLFYRISELGRKSLGIGIICLMSHKKGT